MPPKVIGVAGGVAAGKSTVAGMFARLGAVVIDADEIAKEMLKTPEVVRRVREAWGGRALDAGGLPDRRRIAEIVFGNPAELKRLTDWTHPPTLAEMRARLDRAAADPSTPLVVVDAPLLLEGASQSWCDAVVFVEAAPARRETRAQRSRGWTEGEVARREACQAPLDEKRRRADAVVRNDGAEDETFEQVKRLFRQWTGRDRG
jgi:dephospho-CoA kinase